MIPKLVHQTTRYGSLDFFEMKLFLKNKKKLLDWDFKVWSDDENRNLVLKIFPNYIKIYDSIKIGVAKADIARCLYMYQYGGLYIDTDYLILKKIPESLLIRSCILPISKEENNNSYLGNCVFLSEPYHMFWHDYVEYVFQNLELSFLTENRIISVTGPGGVTDFYLKNIIKYKDIYLPEKEIFHPNVIFHGLRVILTKFTLGVHFCWGSWRTKSSFRILISKLIRILQINMLIFNK
jgi:mannosyltransferase OCH1-like enzyme